MMRLAICIVYEVGLVSPYGDKSHWLGDGEAVCNMTEWVNVESLALLTIV